MTAGTLQKLVSRTLGYGVAQRCRHNSRLARAVFRRLVADEFQSADYWRQAQLEALRALLNHAQEHVPYYRGLFAKIGFNPRGLTSLADLGQLPRLTKNIINERRGELITENADCSRLHRNFTGGSTGMAMEFYQDDRYVAHRGGTTMFSNYLAGWRPGLALARLWGAPRDVNQHASPRARLHDYLMNCHHFNAFELSEARLAAYHRCLERIRPAVLICYVSAGCRLAEFLKTEGCKPGYPTHGVITTAETLQPHMRVLLEEVFGVRVFDRYACREVSCIATECDGHAGLHVHMLSNAVEIDAPANEAEGDILVTNLTNYAMPLIRYEIGDRARRRKKECPCGRGMESIGPVTGRITDFLVGRDGNYVAGPSITVLFYGISCIRQYQLIQEDYDQFVIRVVPNEPWVPTEIERLIGRLRVHLGESARIEIQRLPSIPPTETGKYRFVICKLPQPNVSRRGSRA